jgi:hypothetical protein
MKIFFDAVSPVNQGVIKYLGRGEKAHNPAIAAPDSGPYPYLSQGSHPDIVQRVWEELGGVLLIQCRCLVYGTPAIVQDRTGVVIAICNGTQYNLRLTTPDFREALAKGATTRTRWSDGQEMDSLAVLGPDWIFGGWFKEEAQWCRNAYEEYGGAGGSDHGLWEKA